MKSVLIWIITLLLLVSFQKVLSEETNPCPTETDLLNTQIWTKMAASEINGDDWKGNFNYFKNTSTSENILYLATVSLEPNGYRQSVSDVIFQAIKSLYENSLYIFGKTLPFDITIYVPSCWFFLNGWYHDRDYMQSGIAFYLVQKLLPCSTINCCQYNLSLSKKNKTVVVTS
jgi:hypothetical protein